MSTTLEQLYEMQKVLDARIIKEKGLEGVDLLPNTVLALQVEIGELANCWRGFKHWSNDREPRYERKCHACKGKRRFFEPDAPNEECLYCEGSGIEARPLLEEYVDCVSFFLQIAHQKDWIEHMYIYEDAIDETREKGLDGGVGGALLEVIYWLSKFHMEKAAIPKIEEAFGYSTQAFYFKNAWYVFMAIEVWSGLDSPSTRSPQPTSPRTKSIISGRMMVTEVQLELFSIEEICTTENTVEEKAIEFTALKILECAGCRGIVKRLLSEGKVEQAFTEFKKGSGTFGFAIGDITYMGHQQLIRIRGYEWFAVDHRELFEIAKDRFNSQEVPE